MKCGDISYPAVLCIVNTDEIIIVVFVRIIFLAIVMWTRIIPGTAVYISIGGDPDFGIEFGIWL